MSRFVGNMTWPRFLLGWLTLTVGILALAVAGEVWLHLDGPGVVFGACGVLFLVAASGRPASVYMIVRNMDWFAAIQDDRVMKVVLLCLGLALLGIAPLFFHLPAAAG
jgi:hypothetical protein